MTLSQTAHPQEFQLIIGGKSEPASTAWFVLRVEPFAEFPVVDELLARGFEAYAPWETIRVTNPRRPWVWHHRKLPMIARYAFVVMDAERPRTDLVESVKGVSGMLRSASGAPCRIIGGELDRIRWHQIRGLYDKTGEGTATARRKAKKRLNEAVRQAKVGKIHPFGPTYSVASR